VRSTDTGEVLAGPRVVLEVLRAGRRRVRRVLLGRDAVPESLIALARSRGVPVEVVPRGVLDRCARGATHQGVVAEAEGFPYAELEDVLARGGAEPLIVVLDGIQDPQNLGAILRTAEAAGVHGVIVPRDRAAGVTPAAVRASAGAAEHLPVARVTNLATSLGLLKERGIWAVGADPAGGTDLFHANLTGPLAVVVGAEGKGLRSLTRSRCDLLVRIPLAGRVASLNAAAAAAVCVFEAVRQRRGKDASFR
jgi:23S rRNA (guanosine2251-2'-O)-methyltransferase